MMDFCSVAVKLANFWAGHAWLGGAQKRAGQMSHNKHYATKECFLSPFCNHMTMCYVVVFCRIMREGGRGVIISKFFKGCDVSGADILS